MTIGIGYAVLIGIGMFLVGFMACAGISMGKIDALESALAWLVCDPQSEAARANAQEVLRG